jgi:hypothetical protein
MAAARFWDALTCTGPAGVRLSAARVGCAAWRPPASRRRAFDPTGGKALTAAPVPGLLLSVFERMFEHAQGTGFAACAGWNSAGAVARPSAASGGVRRSGRGVGKLLAQAGTARPPPSPGVPHASA